MTLTEPQTRSRIAPDLYGTAWLNGEPYGIRRGDGDTVLVDFWSSTCVQCLADLERMNRWQEEYASAGLVIVGVHSPEYEFAFSRDHVERTIREQGLTYPVVLDNKGTIRSSYGVHSLPTHTLVDRTGNVRYVLHGRRDFLEFERALQFLLREGGYHGELPSLLDSARSTEPAPDRQDVELRCGYVRGTIGNTEGVAPESLILYSDPRSVLPGRLYLDGPWWSGRESLKTSPSADAASSVRLVSSGGDLYVIAKASGQEHADMTITLDGTALTQELRGSDVVSAGDGSAVVRVLEPRAYHLTRTLTEGVHEITLTSAADQLELFQISIVSAPEPRSIFPN